MSDSDYQDTKHIGFTEENQRFDAGASNENLENHSIPTLIRLSGELVRRSLSTQKHQMKI